MSHDLVAEADPPVEQATLRRAVARALGVRGKDLSWRQDDEWVRVDLEVRIGGGSRAARPHEQVDVVNIHAGLDPGWRSWEKIFRVADAVRETAGLRTFDCQRDQYLDDPRNPIVTQFGVPRAVHADLGADGRFLVVPGSDDQFERAEDLVRAGELRAGGDAQVVRVSGEVTQAVFIAGGPSFACLIGRGAATRLEVRAPARRAPLAAYGGEWPEVLRRGPAGRVLDQHGFRYEPNGKRVRVASGAESPYHPYFWTASPDGERLLECADGCITVRDPAKRVRWSRKTVSHGFQNATFSSDGKLVAFAASVEKRILILDADTGKLKRALTRCGEVGCLEFVAPTRLASGGRGSSVVQLWDLTTGRRAALKTPGYEPIGWRYPVNGYTPAPTRVPESHRSVMHLRSLGRERLLVETSDGLLSIFDLARNECIGVIGICADGKWLVLARDGRWDASDGLERLAWSWVSDVRRYANLWLRAEAASPPSPGLFAELVGG